MSSDYAFMRTGLRDERMNLDPAFVARLEALVYTMIGNAAASACMYAEHSGRRSASVEDVLRALKYEARRFLWYEDLERDVERTAIVLDSLLESSSDAESDGWETASYGSVESDDRTACPCDFCADVNEANDTWERWQPDDPAEIFLRRNVEKTVARFAGEYVG